MKKHTLTIAILALAVVACGGSIDSQEDLMKANMGVMEEMISVLEGVTDQASAEDAKPEIEALAKRMREIADEGAKLPAPTMEEMEAIRKDYAPEFDALMEKAGEQMVKLAQYPDLSSAVTTVMSAGR